MYIAFWHPMWYEGTETVYMCFWPFDFLEIEGPGKKQCM